MLAMTGDPYLCDWLLPIWALVHGGEMPLLVLKKMWLELELHVRVLVHTPNCVASPFY